MSSWEPVGNALCLDFANTVNKRPDPERDLLDSMQTFAQWTAAAGLPMSPGSGKAETIVELGSARKLRERIYRVFAAVAAQALPEAPDVAAIMKMHAAALDSAELTLASSRIEAHWPPPHSVRRVTWAVAASAIQLLVRGPLDRIGECPSCGWLFLDTSRGGKRRWCSMAVCGSRVKARRYYAANRA